MHRRRLAFRFLLMIVAVGLLVACGDDDADLDTSADADVDTGAIAPGADGGAADPAGGPAAGATEPFDDLVATAVTVDGASHTIVDGTTLSLQLRGTTFGADAGCNSLGGNYTLDGELAAGATFTTDGVAQTEMACEPAVMEQELWFAQLLVSSPTLQLADDVWVLAGASDLGATTVTFERRAPTSADAPELLGTTWTADGQVTDTGADATVSSPPEGVSPPTFQLDPSGTVAIFDGCTSFVREYELDGERLRMGPIGIRDTAVCSPWQEAFNALFVDADEVRVTMSGATATVTVDGSGFTFRAG